jgi:hypothetical protein
VTDHPDREDDKGNAQEQPRIVTSEEAKSKQKYYNRARKPLTTFPSLTAFIDDVFVRLLFPKSIDAIRYCRDTANDYANLITAISTVFIAAFTIRLWITSISQWQTLQNQLNESSKEFAATQRARMVLGDETGRILELGETGHDHAFIKIFLRNEGHTPAHEVVVEIWPIVAPPDMAFRYPDLNRPNGFLTGPTIGEDVPFNSHIPIDRKEEEAIKAGNSVLRVAGRIRYWDDFGSYCEPFAAIYINVGMTDFIGTPEFLPALAPPMACRSGPYGEIFRLSADKEPMITFMNLPEVINPNSLQSFVGPTPEQK